MSDDTKDSEEEASPSDQSGGRWGWTGFQGKTLWDWLKLVFVSVALTGLGLWFTQSNQDHERQLADLRTQEDRAIASDQNRDTTLREYLDSMSELLLNRGLATSNEGDPVRAEARARTLTVLSSLKGDGSRKGSVVHFLYGSSLIMATVPTTTIGSPIVNLNGADLSNVYLNGADLSGVDLSGANLSRAELSESVLIKAKLSGANLTLALLVGAELNGADLNQFELVHLHQETRSLINTTLRGALLSRAGLSAAHMYQADLTGADLTRADLRGADLTWADLTGADLTRANLSNKVDDPYAYVELPVGGTNLSNAKLIGADLNGAILTGTVLSSANLTNAKNVTKEQLKVVDSDDGATMPDGTVKPVRTYAPSLTPRAKPPR
jgi:uncharacterized protein YjbI with pentapeptide repeats